MVKNVLVLALLNGFVLATKAGQKNLAQVSNFDVTALKALKLDAEDKQARAERLGKGSKDEEFTVAVLAKLIKEKNKFTKEKEQRLVLLQEKRKLETVLEVQKDKALLQGDSTDIQKKIDAINKKLA